MTTILKVKNNLPKLKMVYFLMYFDLSELFPLKWQLKPT